MCLVQFKCISSSEVHLKYLSDHKFLSQLQSGTYVAMVSEHPSGASVMIRLTWPHPLAEQGVTMQDYMMLSCLGIAMIEADVS